MKKRRVRIKDYKFRRLPRKAKKRLKVDLGHFGKIRYKPIYENGQFVSLHVWEG
jgi:hypothetical protein